MCGRPVLGFARRGVSTQLAVALLPVMLHGVLSFQDAGFFAGHRVSVRLKATLPVFRSLVVIKHESDDAEEDQGEDREVDGREWMSFEHGS